MRVMVESDKLLASIFRSDYLPIVKTYIEQLQSVLQEYNIIIFVARKAYCFFKALAAIGLVRVPDGCRILSSRALTFIPNINERKIALIDDVMITGESVMGAWDTCCKLGKDIDVYVAALCPDELTRWREKPSLRIYAIGELGIEQVHEFAKDITQFIQASGVTNNLDQPVYSVHFSSTDDLDNLVNHPGWIDLSSSVQRACGVVCLTMSFNPLLAGCSDNVLGNVIKNAIIKIRLTRKKGESFATIVPFVLLPELSSSELLQAYHCVALDGLEDFVRASTNRQTLINRLRVLHFALAVSLCEAVVGSWGDVASYSRDKDSEISLFGFEILPYLRPNTWVPNFRSSEVVDMPGELPHWLDYCSALMYSKHLVKAASRELNSNKDSNSGSTVSDLGEPLKRLAQHGSLKDTSPSESSESCRSLISACLDVLIDRGVLVPFTRLRKLAGSYRLVRAYRGGEVMYITEADLHRFSYLLGRFSERIGADVDDDVVGRMGVVYLRSRTARSSAAVDGVEPFSLVFAPRDFSYQAGERDGGGSLVSMMVDMGLLKKEGGGKFRSSVRKTDKAISGAERVRLDSNAAFFAGVYGLFKNNVDFASKYESFCHILERMAVGTSDDYSVACLLWQARRVKHEMNKGFSAKRESVKSSLDEARYWRGLVINTEETLSMLIGLAGAMKADAASAISLVPSLFQEADRKPPSFNMLLSQFDDLVARATLMVNGNPSAGELSIMDFNAIFEIFEEGAKVVTGHLPRKTWVQHGGVPMLVEKNIIAITCRNRGKPIYGFFSNDYRGPDELESACVSCLETGLAGVSAVVLFADDVYRPTAILSSATERITMVSVFPKNLREELKSIKLWTMRHIDKGGPPVLMIIGRDKVVERRVSVIAKAAALCKKEMRPSRMRIDGLSLIDGRHVRIFRLISLENKMNGKGDVYLSINSNVGSMGPDSHGTAVEVGECQRMSAEEVVDKLVKIDKELESVAGFADADRVLARQDIERLVKWIAQPETKPTDSEVRSTYWTLNGVLKNASSLATIWAAICETIKLFLGI